MVFTLLSSSVTVLVVVFVVIVAVIVAVAVIIVIVVFVVVVVKNTLCKFWWYQFSLIWLLQSVLLLHQAISFRRVVTTLFFNYFTVSCLVICE